MHLAAHKQRPPLHPQEKWFLTIVLVQLVFLPWAFGTMHAWSQLTSLGLAALSFVLALVPRTYSGDYAVALGVVSKPENGNLKPEIGNTSSALKFQPSGLGSAYRLSAWPRLIRFPLFWLGLVLLAYLGLQAFNPSWVYTQNTKQWWLVRVNDIPWLPTSVETPFARFNLWRSFIIYATVWLTVCALWIGITRRRTLHILLSLLVGNAVILGLVGFVQKASGEGKLLWLQSFPDASSFASFVYQNHAGAYFSLMSFAALGLAVWHFFEGRKRMARSTPAALWLIGALLLVFAVIFSMSRGAIISLAVFGVAAVLALILLRSMSSTQSTTPTLVPVLVAFAILGTLGFMVREIDFSAVYFRFQQLSKLQANDPSYVSRKLAGEAAAKMYGDSWVRGVGAGGFRYLFPEYVKNKPEIYEGGKYFWEHAHNDWLEIPIELGLVGVALLVAAFGWIVWAWVRAGGLRHPLAVMIALGAGQIMAHALIDFPFHNPAILVTWWALLVISLRWLELDGGGRAAKD
ncbi:MAG: O-antigen ligase family protein [Lacunisphaera sp.]|nr:O-antigen ligase family protein [Lacunisphaera sp.]